jgi:hypothetical protein
MGISQRNPFVPLICTNKNNKKLKIKNKYENFKEISAHILPNKIPYFFLN